MMARMMMMCQFVRNWWLILPLLQVVWTTTNGIDMLAPANVTVSEITCTSALVSWDEPTDGGGISYTVWWRLLDNRGNRRRPRPWERMENVTAQHLQLTNLLPSSDDIMRNYSVRVSNMKEEGTSETFFSTNSNAVAVQPFATPSESGVTIEWSTPHVNTGCDGNKISQYLIRYNPVGSANASEVMLQTTKQNVMKSINDTMPHTHYEYTVVAIDPHGENATSDTKYFTTQADLPLPPTLLSAELDSDSITVTWKQPIDASSHKISCYVVKVRPVTADSTTIYVSYPDTGDELYKRTIENLMSDTLYEIMVASESSVGMGSFSVDHLLALTTSFVPIAPVNLTAKAVSNRMLMVSWTYPSSLIEQITSFEVTYSLVSTYNTSGGVKSFAESDVFNTTEMSFHFALISSVTNYVFTVTPYSATHAGDSARVIVDDLSGVDLVENSVIFFNLRLSDPSNSPSSSSEINKKNSDLTRHMQSSINDVCQCTLPSYTLRGSMDLCEPQSNCAIYTGRLLGSDTASATEVFEMVEEWLSTQNGSLLNGTLSVDPDCPLRRLSPSDMVCSSIDNINSDAPTEDDASVEENESSDDRKFIEVIKMVAVGFGSGFGVIICAVMICMCVFKSRQMMRRKKSNTVTYSESEARMTPFLQTADAQRHYSIVIERNPSYSHHRRNAVKQVLCNGRQLDACSSGSLTSENPYSYTSLKTAQRQADALATEQKEEGITHLTVDQPCRHVSESSNNEYVVESLTPSEYYCNEDSASTFHPSSPNSQGQYLSVS